MDREQFIQRLDAVYHLVEQEYQLSVNGLGNRSKQQLAMIRTELKRMRSALDRHIFMPYYPRGITDDWPHEDWLGLRLLELAEDYHKL